MMQILNFKGKNLGPEGVFRYDLEKTLFIFLKYVHLFYYKCIMSATPLRNLLCTCCVSWVFHEVDQRKISKNLSVYESLRVKI